MSEVHWYLSLGLTIVNELVRLTSNTNSVFRCNRPGISCAGKKE